MKLRTRLTTAVVVVSSAGTFLLGGVAISEVRNSRVAAVDQALVSVIAQVTAQTSDQLGSALLAADQLQTPVALGFVAEGTDFTWVRDIADKQLPAPSADERTASFADPITTSSGYRMMSVRMRDGETVVVAASITAIQQQMVTDIISLTLFWILLSLVVGVIIHRLVRRDVVQLERLVEIASGLAEGRDAGEIPEASSSLEVQTLATALRRMVGSLQGAIETQRLTNQRMQEFVGDASHELRTPLTVIKGYLELLEQDVDPAQRERALRRMRSEAQRMELLVQDLLLLAEIGTPIEEPFEVLDLTALIRVLVDDLRELQPTRSVESRIDGSVLVRAVPSHLHRAVGNAFANIRRHTDDSAPVRVALRATGDLAELVIEDGGPGLSDEMYEQGIGHFQRFDKSRARASGGSGLGMSIIAAVMAELGGDVVIAPSDLGGLRLRYHFPIAH